MSRDHLGCVHFETPADESIENIVLECRKNQIFQILTNLIRNACDAVEGAKNPWIKLEAENRDGAIRFAVVDNGPGVPASVRQGLLRPGFSTKPRGKGAGLGLKISSTLAEAHGGELILDESSKFTRFVLILPKRQARGDFDKAA